MTPRRKVLTALAAVLLLAGLTGVAVAANHAGLGLALEKASAGNGEAAERLEEAQTLAASGKAAEALAHAADAITQLSSEGDPDFGEAAEALGEAADNVESNGAEQSEDVRSNVAELLRWMADQFDEEEFDGRAFGEGVSSQARQIAGAPEELEGQAGATETEENGDNIGGPPEDVPGPPDDTPGPPTGQGG